MKKYQLPTNAEFQAGAVTGSRPDWMTFEDDLMRLGATDNDVWGFHHRMLELVGHKSDGAVPDAEERAASYAVLMATWNSFDGNITAAQFETALRNRIQLDHKRSRL